MSHGKTNRVPLLEHHTHVVMRNNREPRDINALRNQGLQYNGHEIRQTNKTFLNKYESPSSHQL